MTRREVDHALQLARDEVAWWETASPVAQLRRPRAYLVQAQALLDLHEAFLSYEGAITWGCSSVERASMLDKNYEQYVEIAELREAAQEFVDAASVYGRERYDNAKRKLISVLERS